MGVEYWLKDSHVLITYYPKNHAIRMCAERKPSQSLSKIQYHKMFLHFSLCSWEHIVKWKQLYLMLLVVFRVLSVSWFHDCNIPTKTETPYTWVSCAIWENNKAFHVPGRVCFLMASRALELSITWKKQENPRQRWEHSRKACYSRCWEKEWIKMLTAKMYSVQYNLTIILLLILALLSIRSL